MAASMVSAAAFAQEPLIFNGADFGLGEKLMAEQKCVACHIQKVGGNGAAIYRPLGRINTAGFCAVW